MPDEATITALAEAITAKRVGALEFLDLAAEFLTDARARLRYAPGDTSTLGDALEIAEAAMTDGRASFNAMVALGRNLSTLVTAEPPRAPVQTTTIDRRLGELADRIASSAEREQADLGALADVVRCRIPGTPDDVARLFENIQSSHALLKASLAEAGEVGNCAGSA